MTFPQKTRVVYGKNPLVTVACQLEFPSILSIDSEKKMAEFQEILRHNGYPSYTVSTKQIKQPSNISLRSSVEPEQVNTHSFQSDDGKFVLFLNHGFLSFETKKYEQWEIFNNKLEYLLNEFDKYFEPSFYTKIGLVYVDVFDRKKMGLSTSKVKLSDILQPFMLGMLNTDDIRQKVSSYQSVTEINLFDNESILKVSQQTMRRQDDEALCVLVNSEFYYPKKILFASILPKLDFLHKDASNFIQWIVTPDFHLKMEPKEINELNNV